MEFKLITDCENALNISLIEDVIVSLICNGNEIKDCFLNDITGAESQCDLINKYSSTFLPHYVKTFKTRSKLHKCNNKLDIITLNNEPIATFINENEKIVDEYLWELQDNTSMDDTFKRSYDIIRLKYPNK